MFLNIIDVHELTKIYQPRMKKGGITALDGISLTVQQPEIFGLLGPNGAGKTTLFKILLGITMETSGTCSINGLSPSNPKSRLKVGFLPENHRFPGHLTGFGLLETSAMLYGIPSAVYLPRIDELLDSVGMSKWSDTLISKYSKGMLQRVGLAQALISDPDLLMLDEPTDGIDPIGKKEIKDLLQKLRDNGKTIFLNSHLLADVEELADRVCILQAGKIAKIGTIAELTSRKSQYEIKADIGHQMIDVPERIGKRVSISTNSLVVELIDDDKLNDMIGIMLMKKVQIKAVNPLKVSLEQSFYETITHTGDSE